MKRIWIILTLSLASGIAAVQPCRRFTLHEHGKAVNAHKMSKDRVAAIVAWNKEHPEWVKRWRAEHIIHDTEVLLCPEPTLDQELMELLPPQEPPKIDTERFRDISFELPPLEFTPTGYYVPDALEDVPNYPPITGNAIYAGYVMFSPKSATTPESRTWVLLVIGIIVGVSYIQSFRSLR